MADEKPASPSIGRIVHFHSPRSFHGKGPHAAVVTSIWDNAHDVVALTVFWADGEPAEHVGTVMPEWRRIGIDARPDYWTWPPRV